MHCNKLKNVFQDDILLNICVLFFLGLSEQIQLKVDSEVVLNDRLLKRKPPRKLTAWHPTFCNGPYSPWTSASSTFTLREDKVHPLAGKSNVALPYSSSELSRHQPNNLFMVLQDTKKKKCWTDGLKKTFYVHVSLFHSWSSSFEVYPPELPFVRCCWAHMAN